MLYNIFLEPFIAFLFMKKALVGSIAIALGCGPLGLIMFYRRMSLMADAVSHAMLPGVALGFFLFKGDPIAMMIGGVFASLFVAAVSQYLSKDAVHSHDSSFAVFYLISLALGIILISAQGSPRDLSHILFGNILTLPDTSLAIVVGVSVATFLFCALFIRPLVIQSVDPSYIKSPAFWTWCLLLFVIMNLVSSFQAMGTLLSVGLLLIPAAAASFWRGGVIKLVFFTFIVGLLSSYFGLILSFHFNFPSGPAIVVVSGVFFIFSFLFGNGRGNRGKVL